MYYLLVYVTVEPQTKCVCSYYFGLRFNVIGDFSNMG